MGADSSDINRSLEQRIDNVMILGGVLKTEPKSKQKTGTGNRGLGSARGSCRVDRNEVARAFKLWFESCASSVTAVGRGEVHV